MKFIENSKTLIEMTIYFSPSPVTGSNDSNCWLVHHRVLRSTLCLPSSVVHHGVASQAVFCASVAPNFPLTWANERPWEELKADWEDTTAITHPSPHLPPPLTAAAPSPWLWILLDPPLPLENPERGFLRPSFLNPGTADMWGHIILCCSWVTSLLLFEFSAFLSTLYNQYPTLNFFCRKSCGHLWLRKQIPITKACLDS